MTTLAAPSFFNASAAFTIVPPVSIMSVTRMEGGPSASPTEGVRAGLVGGWEVRVLGVEGRRAAAGLGGHWSGALVGAASGETIARSRVASSPGSEAYLS